MKLYRGISLNDWAIPLHIFAGKPFTDEKDRWVTQMEANTIRKDLNPIEKALFFKRYVVITILCFYLAIEI